MWKVIFIQVCQNQLLSLQFHQKIMSDKHARRARRAKADKKNRCISQTRAAITSRSQKNVTVVKKGNNTCNSGLATIQISRLRKQLQKAQSQIKVLQQKCNSLQRKWTVADAIEFIDNFIINKLITNKIKFVFVNVAQEKLVLIVYVECCSGTSCSSCAIPYMAIFTLLICYRNGQFVKIENLDQIEPNEILQCILKT